MRLKIDLIKENPDNPRVIKGKKFDELVRSIKDFPKMMELRPVVLNGDDMVLGGNQRLGACKELKWKDVPVEYFLEEDAKRMNRQRKKDGLEEKTYEEFCEEFVIKDNTSFGEWDWKVLRGDKWDVSKLKGWGLDDLKLDNKPEGAGDVEFSEFIGEENNYIVLVFRNEIDWLNAKQHFNLKTVYSTRANGNIWSKGIGRVVDGGKYLTKMINGK